MSDSKFTVIGTLYLEETSKTRKYVCAISNDYDELSDDEKLKHIKAIRDMFKEKVKEIKQLKKLEDRDND